MKNYEYIIAGLPVIDSGFKFGETTPDLFIAEIRSQLDRKDNGIVDFLLKGYDENCLTPEFYEEAVRHANRFIREYFTFDLNLRNAKVRYLNRELGREAEKDLVTLRDSNGDPVEFPFEEEAAVKGVLERDDLLSRERGLDDLVWDKISRLTVFNFFDIDAVLAFIAKMQVAARWYRLDEESGRELFRRLVDEVRGTFKLETNKNQYYD